MSLYDVHEEIFLLYLIAWIKSLYLQIYHRRPHISAFSEHPAWSLLWGFALLVSGNLRGEDVFYFLEKISTCVKRCSCHHVSPYLWLQKGLNWIYSCLSGCVGFAGWWAPWWQFWTNCQFFKSCLVIKHTSSFVLFLSFHAVEEMSTRIGKSISTISAMVLVRWHVGFRIPAVFEARWVLLLKIHPQQHI